MDLVVEALDVLGACKGLLELLDVLGRLVARSQQDHGDSDAFGVLGVDHGGMDGSQDAEGVGELVGDERDDLAAPAELLCAR